MTNKAVSECHSQEELLAALLAVLKRHGAYSFVYIAGFADGPMSARLLLHHAIPPGQLPHLAESLSDPAGPLAEVFAQVAGR